MTSLNHNNNLCLVTLPYPSSTPPSSSAASSSSTSSNGWTDKITKKIKELKSELESLKNLKIAKNGYLPEIDSKSLDSLPTQLTSLETVQKLAEFAEQLDTTENASNNILTNLCDGLETFLGFNSSSKGYTGQGIVYSDLDRLCDGVMGFLSGVLSNIKEHLGQHKNEMDIAIKSLNDNKRRGKNGFNDAIVKVVAGVRGYNKAVEQSNEKIKKPINDLLSRLGTTLTDKLNKILPNDDSGTKKFFTTDEIDRVKKAVSDLDSLVKEYLGNAETFRRGIDNAAEYILDLNNVCRTSVDNVKNSIIHETKGLVDLSTRAWKDLNNMSNEISETLVDLARHMEKKIEHEIGELVRQLTASIAEILRNLRGVNEDLWNYVKEIEKWIVETNKVINGIMGEANYIIEQKPGRHNQQNIIDIAERDLKEWKIKLAKYVDEDIRPTLTKLVDQATNNVNELDSKIRIGLGDLKLNLYERIEQYVKDLKNGRLKVIRDGVGKKDENTRSGIIGNWYSLIDELDKIIRDIYGNEPIKGQGLKGIREKVKGYSAKIGGTIQDAISGWLNKILADNDVVNMYIDWYVTDPSIKSQGNLSGVLEHDRKAVRDAIGNPIKELFAAIRVENVGGEYNKVADMLNAINKFHSDVADVIESGADDKRTGSIADKVEGVLKLNVSKKPDPDPKRHLQAAIQAALTHLPIIVRKVANEIKAFTTETDGRGNEQYNVGKNVDEAILNVDKICLHFGDPRSLGGKITDELQNVNRQIKLFENSFENKIKTEVARVFKESHSDSKKVGELLSNYRAHKNLLSQYLSAIHQRASDITVEATTNALTNLSNQITQNLNDLLNTFTATGRALKEQSENLKCVNVNLGLSQITEHLEYLRSQALTKAINLTESIDREAILLNDSTILNLQNYVSYHVDSATKLLTTAARRNYVTSVKALLTAFADKVEKELAPLPGVIDKDRREGFKGFMRTLEDGTVKDLRGMQSKNINKLKNLIPNPPVPMEYHPKDFRNLAENFYDFCEPLKTYLLAEIRRVHNENMSKKNPVGTAQQHYSGRVETIYNALESLCFHLRAQNKYDRDVPAKLSKLNDAVVALKPDGFDLPNTPVLDGIVDGLSKFVQELKKVYISVYDGQDFDSSLLDNTDSRKSELTPEGRNCAKVFMTLLEILKYDLDVLHKHCQVAVGGWKDKNICLLLDGDMKNDLGLFLQRCGYRVASNSSSQDGELKRHDDWTGNKIKELLIGDHTHLYNAADNIKHAFQNCYEYLKPYYQVGHLSTSSSTKHPCSIFQMLVWFSGLPNNQVYRDVLFNGFDELFQKPDEQAIDIDGDVIAIDNLEEASLEAYPQTITVSRLAGALTDVCTQSHSALTAVLGHGHADGTYACDYNTNEYKFAYPSRPSQCLDLIVEMSCRMYHQLSFLYTHCSRTYDAVSWRDCWYGKEVGGSSWECNEIQCPDLRDNQKGNQMCNQNANQKCEQHPKCGIKSPLQSFLEDGLPGFLPHPYSKAACKITCAAPNHNGIPCKTPMGFTDISVAASHRQQGEHLKEILQDFCGTARSPLTVLCSMLTCILHRTPQTLDDMFAFYYNFLTEWDGSNTKRRPHRETAFTDAVKKANFDDPSKSLDIVPMFKNSEHKSGEESTHRKGDLFSLYKCHYDDKPAITCGRYLQPTNMVTWVVFSSSNADRYLSWIVYLTETFYDLLERLWKDCCKSCNNPGNRCHDKNCVESCAVKAYYKSEKSTPETGNAAKPVVQSPRPKHDNLCKSIAQCPFSRPHLYKYGFVLNSMTNLSGSKDLESKRTCGDFCKTLERVLNKNEKDAAPLATLIYRTIPDFLWEIRKPFSYLVLALWLLSFLYLLHIMVIRLDLLHIKSHLHSPSSHRIAAQSLLAAGRVNKLNRVFYLQP